MMETLVFIFLLDHLPGNGLNKTESFNVTPTLTPAQDLMCNVKVTDPLLQIISRELDLLMVPEWLLNENSTEKFHADSDASFGARAIELMMQNEVGNYSEIGNSSDIAVIADLNDVDYVVTDNPRATKAPEQSPMLVAIFESVSNVTAQTCAGTLLAPNWVLTAASCVNLLGNTTKNFINSTEESVYTIVVNATDPLSDGTAHNVTQILEYPSNEVTKSHGSTEDIYVTEGHKSNATENSFSNAADSVKFFVNHKNEKAIEFLKISKIIQPQPTRHPDITVTDMPSINAINAKEKNYTNNVRKTSQTVAKNVQESNKTDDIRNTQEVPSNIKEIAHFTEDNNADPDIKRPSIALMRIEPPVSVENVNIASHVDGIKVVVHGWVMRDDETDHETMHKLSLEALTLPHAACAVQYNISRNMTEDELCLASLDPHLALAGQMSWGGPVVAPSGELVAVSRGDGSAPLSATPLAQYSDWIQAVIHST